jgi:hypothetical protein
MNDLRAECLAAILAFVISIGYVLSPGPYWMGAFTFIAQPLFFLVMASYAVKVWQDLRGRRVL